MSPPLPPLSDRVAAGAALLSRHLRPGWAADLDCRRLDLRSMDLDVLGQLFGSFGEGILKLFGPTAGVGRLDRPSALPSPAWLHGFADGPSDYPGSIEAAWIAEVRSRLDSRKGVAA